MLTYKGFSTKQLIKIFGVSLKILNNWWTRWERFGIIGLYDAKGKGRKSKLNQAKKEQVKEWVKSEPKNLNKTLAKIKKDWGITTSKDTVKRIIKKLRMTWKRVKRGLAGNLDKCELEVKEAKLLELKEKEKKGEINLRYFDETGLSLTPYIPYGWQEKGATITAKSSRSKRINILELMDKNNNLYYEIFWKNINSQIVIDFF